MEPTMTDQTDKKKTEIKPSIVWAAVTAGLVIIWLTSGIFNSTSKLDENADATASEAAELLHVQAQHLKATPRTTQLIVRGRTQALRSVEMKSEVSGTVSALPIEKGSFVTQGDIICELSLDSRDAQFEEAKALFNQRRLEWAAAKRLAKQGHRSETQTAASKAAFEAAKAQMRRTEDGVKRTKIRAPFNGILNDRQVDIGDFVQPGQICGIVVDQDPFLVVAQVSERDVTRIELNGPGVARLVNGIEVAGIVRYISTSAEPATRTFRVELEIPNSEGLIREGITSELLFPMHAVPAHQISPAILNLDAQGTIGVSIIGANETVQFMPVTIISDATEGIWITGLPDEVTIITAGQELVVSGQKVRFSLIHAASS